MLHTWLECLKKLPRTPAFVERSSVLRARSANLPPSRDANAPESTLWVDISVISRRDAGSGIQRVVRALLVELQTLSIPGWRIQPVAATPRLPYREVPWEIPTVTAAECKKIEPRAGDIFLGLDLSAHIVPRHQREMLAWKRRGLKLGFVIYDLLPLHRPDWFSAKLVRAFRRWIKSVAILADQVFCISQLVKQDFDEFMYRRYALPAGEIPAHVFPMGADIKASQPSIGFPKQFFDKLALISQGKAALMVGTIEPRKGYVQILDAFEHLWADGYTYKLVIVGKPGWMTEGLQSRITNSRYRDERLFWFDDASDEALQALYQKCTGVIAASYAEGYGLPMLEAVEHGKPVLARDILAFRQFETPLVSYFAAESNAEAISVVIDRWLEVTDKPVNPIDPIIPRSGPPSWRASLDSLLGQLLPPQAIVAAWRSEFA